VADVVQGIGLTDGIGDGLEQREGLLGVAQTLGGVALMREQPANILVGLGLSGAIAEVPVQVRAFGELGMGLVVVAEPGEGVGEQAAGGGLPGRVGEARRGVKRGCAGQQPSRASGRAGPGSLSSSRAAARRGLRTRCRRPG
jgi:hypothetical protein